MSLVKHIDWGLVLALVVALSVGTIILQASGELANAERGLILYEQFCPLNQHSP
jgi:hypothetical protein